MTRAARRYPANATQLRTAVVRWARNTRTCPRCCQPIFVDTAYLDREVTSPVRHVRTHVTCPDQPLWNRPLLGSDDHWGVLVEATMYEAGLPNWLPQPTEGGL
jgi:hypothetical protein